MTHIWAQHAAPIYLKPTAMKTSYQAIISTPICYLGICTQDDLLQKIDFLTSAKLIKPTTAFAKEVIDQLEAYFKNPKHKFHLPLINSGTAFQQRVWKALTYLKPGESLAYGDLATQLKTGPRAIGNACRHNPTPIVVPCHRIVGKNHLGGFSGARGGKWLEMKAWLLQHEAQ